MCGGIDGHYNMQPILICLRANLEIWVDVKLWGGKVIIYCLSKNLFTFI